MANVQVKLHAGFQVFWPLDVLFLLFLCLFRHHRLHTRIVQMYALLHALFFFFFLHARRVCCLILSLPFALRTSCPSLFFFFFLHARRVFCLCTTICICLGSSPVSSILLNVFINTVSMASPPSVTSSADRPSLSALLWFLHLVRARLYSCVVMGSLPFGMLLYGACGGRPC